MHFDTIKHELEKRGICCNLDYIDVYKNTGLYKAIRVTTSDGNCSPVIYYGDGDTVQSISDKIEAALKEMPVFDTSILNGDQKFFDNLRISVERKNPEPNDIVSRECLNIDAVLRLQVSSTDDEAVGSIRVPHLLLNNKLHISDRRAWESAMDNLRGRFVIRTITEVLGFPPMSTPDELYVLTTHEGTYGASALLFPEIFHDFCQERGITSCIILPSSTEELLIKVDNDVPLQDLACLVNDINNSMVDDVIRLDPVVYRYDTNSNLITIAASYEV